MNLYHGIILAIFLIAARVVLGGKTVEIDDVYDFAHFSSVVNQNGGYSGSTMLLTDDIDFSQKAYDIWTRENDGYYR